VRLDTINVTKYGTAICLTITDFWDVTPCGWSKDFSNTYQFSEYTQDGGSDLLQNVGSFKWSALHNISEYLNF